LVLARDSEPGEPARGHVTVPEPNRRLATDLTTVWTRRDGVVAPVPTIDCGDRTAVIEVTKNQH
jgi:transposase InsO family protein